MKTRKIKIKTIDVTAKEWFDKINGNSYFSANICINYGQPNQVNLSLPFQYGYGEHYLDMAAKELQEKGFIKLSNPMQALWSYCNDNKIILRYQKHKNCLKKDVVLYGQD